MAATPTISPELMGILMNAPVGSPPPGVVPDFLPSPAIVNYGGWMTLGILTLLTTTFVCLRLYTKLFIQRGVLVEDYFLLLGLLAFFAYQVLAMLGMYSGVAQDIWNVQLKTWLHEAMLLNLVAIVYVASMWAVKLSILLQFLTIFVPERHLNRAVFFATWIAIIFTTIFSVIFIGVCIWACNPREKIWNPFIGGTCVNFIAMMEASGIINIAVDIAILLIPLKATWQLRMDTRRKISVCVVFSAGILANVSSIARTVYTFQLPYSDNPSRQIFFVGLWGTIELAVGILISSSFVFPQLIRTTFRKYRSRSSSRSLSTGYLDESRSCQARNGLSNRAISPPVVTRRVEISRSAYSEKTLQDLRDLASLPTWPAEVYHSVHIGHDVP